MMGRHQRELSVALALGLFLGLLRVAAPDFYRGDKLQAILIDSAPVLVVVVGMTLVILTGHIDLSVGSQFAVCAVAAGLLAQAGVPMPAVVLAAVLLGAGLGAVNGALVAGLGLPSIVVTLATFVMLREGLRWWRVGESVKNLPADFQWFGFGQDLGQRVVVGVVLTVFAAAAWGLRHLAAGRAVYATGSDAEAAWLVGVRPRRVVFSVFVIVGALSGLAALLNAVRFAEVGASARTGLEMEVIAAVVVGGVAISGGRGTLVGPLFGLALLAVIRPALLFLWPQQPGAAGQADASYWTQAIQGAIILVAVAADALQLRLRSHARARTATP
jgi:rhamnose transport system permease protein